MFLDNWYKAMLVFVKDERRSDPATVLVKAVDGTTGQCAPCYGSNNTYIFTPLSLFNQNPNSSYGYNPSMFFISNNNAVYYGSGNSTTSYPSNWGVIIGDGDTPVTIDDYCLSGNQITDFTATTGVTVTQNGNKITGSINYTITNTGAASFTIKEIGATCFMSAYSYGIAKRVMIYRKVLDTPITIAPGDSGIINLTIEIS